MNNETGKKEFTLQVRVYYEDTDAGGVVYHSNYLNFMERARTEWLRHIGFEQHTLIEKDEILFAVRKISIDYHKPALFNELLNIKTRIIQSRRASLVFEQIIFNQSEETICKAEIKIACLNSNTMKPESIPETILLELN
ncbi:MAG: tol-pal system-associated acyl-CoA thioesterase [Proteobacteria bacterium]|nr:tol-pal system-associated acyl-CoA thioesterase [Pseudomonadota bacterium]